jgi:hypothetical protein
MALWHFTSAYTVAGRPKGETALMNYARNKWLYQMVLEEELDEVVEDIEVEQARILKENPRLRRTEVSISKLLNHHQALFIGQQNLSMIEVLPMVKKNKFPKEQ